jgi:anti-sigma factor RsiW
MHHPEAGELLLFVDGELPRAAQTAIRRHLESCWKCRTELEQLQTVISEFMRYRSKCDEAPLPVSRCSGAELRRKLEQRDREKARPSVLAWAQRMLGLAAVGGFRRLSTAFLVLAGVGLAVVLTNRLAPRLWNKPEPPPPVVAPVAQLPASPVVRAPKIGNAPAPLRPKPELERLPAANAEVAASVKLHDLGADLGEPVEVVPAANGAAAVVCRQIGREREAEIRAAMAGLAGVSVRAEPAPEGSAKKPGSAMPGVGASAAEPALIAALGSRSAYDSLANEILEADDAVLSRAHAVGSIEERFPPARRAALGAADRAALERIVSDHLHAARETGQRLALLLATIPGALGVSGGAETPVPRSSLLAAAQRMDRIVGVVFGGSPSRLTVRELGVELNAARAQLASALEAGR